MQRNTQQYVIQLLSIILITFMTIVSCSNEQGAGQNMQRQRGNTAGMGRRQSEAVPVKATEAKLDDISAYILKPASLEAEKEVDILAQTMGFVTHRYVEEGDLVKKNQILLALDRSEMEIAYREAKARMENQQREFDRSQRMLEQNLISQEVFDAQKFQYETAESQYDRARLDLSYTRIRAPFTGIITRRDVDIGDYVRVNLPVFQIADFIPILARIYVSEKDMHQVQVGQNARITVDTIPDTSFTGTVIMVSPVVDPQSGTVKVTVEVEDERKILKPGMFCSVFIITEVHSDVVVIPKRALLMDSEEDIIFIINEGAASRRNIEVGFIDQDRIEVLKGITAGELVITVGQEGLRDGAAVRIPDMESDTPVLAAAEMNSQGNQNSRESSESDAVMNRSGRERTPVAEMSPEQMERMLSRFPMVLERNEDFRKAWEAKVKEDPSIADDTIRKIEFMRENAGFRRGRPQ